MSLASSGQLERIPITQLCTHEVVKDLRQDDISEADARLLQHVKDFDVKTTLEGVRQANGMVAVFKGNRILTVALSAGISSLSVIVHDDLPDVECLHRALCDKTTQKSLSPYAMWLGAKKAQAIAGITTNKELAAWLGVKEGTMSRIMSYGVLCSAAQALVRNHRIGYSVIHAISSLSPEEQVKHLRDIVEGKAGQRETENRLRRKPSKSTKPRQENHHISVPEIVKLICQCPKHLSDDLLGQVFHLIAQLFAKGCKMGLKRSHNLAKIAIDLPKLLSQTKNRGI